MCAVALAPTAPLLAAPQAAPRALELPSSTGLLCLDSTGTYQPVQRANYGTLVGAMAVSFKMNSRLVATSSEAGELTFSGSEGYEVIYQVRPRSNGLALLSMQVRTPTAVNTIRGNDMCWRTFEFLNIKP